MQKLVAVVLVLVLIMGIVIGCSTPKKVDSSSVAVPVPSVQPTQSPLPLPSPEPVNESTYNTQECHAMLEDFFERTGGYEKYKQQAIEKRLTMVRFNFIDINYDQIPEVSIIESGFFDSGDLKEKTYIYDLMTGELLLPPLKNVGGFYRLVDENGVAKTLVTLSPPILINITAYVEIYNEETQKIEANTKYIVHDLSSDDSASPETNAYGNDYMHTSDYSHAYDGTSIDFNQLSEYLEHRGAMRMPLHIVQGGKSAQVPVKQVYDYLYSHNIKLLTQQQISNLLNTDDEIVWVKKCSFPKKAVIDSPVQNKTEITQSTKTALEKLLNTGILEEVSGTNIKIGLEDITKDGKPEVFLTYTANDENGYPMPCTNAYSLKDNRLLFSTFGLQKILKNDQTGDTLFWAQYYDNQKYFALSRYNSSVNSFENIIATIMYTNARTGWQNEQSIKLKSNNILAVYKRAIFENSMEPIISVYDQGWAIRGSFADVVIYEGYNPTPLDFTGYGVVVQNADGTYSVAKNAG